MAGPAYNFQTITDADWARELRAARQRGADEGNLILARIRSAMKLHEAKTLAGIGAGALEQRPASRDEATKQNAGNACDA